MFLYFGNIGKIRSAVALANDLVINKEFLEDIENQSFDMATIYGDDIVYDIKNASQQLTVVIYKSRNPWSKAYGYFSPATPNKIFLNSRKLNRSTTSIVASLIHEMIHWLDSNNKNESYGHGDNSSLGKANTAPYWIGNLAGSFDFNSKTIPNYNNNENSKIYVYRSFLYFFNPFNWRF